MANDKTSNAGPARERYRWGNRGLLNNRRRLERHFRRHPLDGVAKTALHGPVTETGKIIPAHRFVKHLAGAVHDFVCLVFHGEPEPQGPQGVQGPRGYKGEKGDPGRDGEEGTLPRAELIASVTVRLWCFTWFGWAVAMSDIVPPEDLPMESEATQIV